MKVKDCLFRLNELRGKISGGDEKFDKERITALNFAENAIVSAPITCENIFFDEYGFAHDRKTEKPLTNADRIRSMTDNELAVFLYGLVNEFNSKDHDSLDLNYCKIHAGEPKYDGWLLWVRQEAIDG